MKTENGKLIPECLHDIDIFNMWQMKKWNKEIKEMANGDINEEIKLRMALLKCIEIDYKNKK